MGSTRRQSELEQKNKKLTETIVAKMRSNHVTQKRLAELSGKSQQQMSILLREERLTAMDLINIFDILDFSGAEIIDAMRLR